MVVCLISRAAASDPLPLGSYSGFAPLAGDDHRHAGTVKDHNDLLNLGTTGSCPDPYLNQHQSGPAPAVYDHMAAAGYDWANLSFHLLASATDFNTSSTNPQYIQWTTGDQTARTDPVYQYVLQRSPAGLPDYATGLFVLPPWNEAKSLSTAAASRSAAGSFAAFSGREWTRNEGHTIAIPAGDTSDSCAAVDGGPTCKPEILSDLYKWIARSSGVLVLAHPRTIDTPASFFAPWKVSLNSCGEPDAIWEAGFSDRYYAGIEIAAAPNFSVKNAWEVAYRVATSLGYRLFPSYGSDHHRLHSGVLGCYGQANSLLSDGAAVCWTDKAQNWTRADVIEAMKGRSCYYSSGFKPVLQIEACSATDPACNTSNSATMGDLLDVAGQVRVNVYAQNDALSQDPNQPAGARRMRRLELVSISGSDPDDTDVIAWADLTPTCIGSQEEDCCGLDAGGDRCHLSAVVNLSAGALYARACDLSGSQTECGEGNFRIGQGQGTLAVSAPIFVNWDEYRDDLSAGQGGCNMAWEGSDFDQDLVPDRCDNCIEAANTDQKNRDGDEYGDACDADDDADGVADFLDLRPMIPDANGDSDGDGFWDFMDNCPSVANATQADVDGDGVGDGCDNCAATANPMRPWNYTCTKSWATLTGGQRDDDHDGYGNRCDGKFTEGTVVDANDLAEMVASLPPSQGGTGTVKLVTNDNCGTTNNRVCAAFDVSESDGIIPNRIDAIDLGVLENELLGLPVGPKCAACPLACTNGTNGSCQ